MQLEGAQPSRCGRDRLPELVAVEYGRFGQLVAVFLVDRVAVGGFFGIRAVLAGPALNLGEYAGVVGCFAQLDFPRVGFGSGAAWECACCSEEGGQEEKL